MNRSSLIFLIWTLTTPAVFEQKAEVNERWRTLSGQPRESGGFEKFLYLVMKEHDVTALSVAVVQDTDVVFQRTLGLVDRESEKPVNEETVFRAASLSKPVFAYLVMRLVDGGVLELDRPLYEYLDQPLYEYPAYSSLRNDPRYERLTAGLVLSHQTGLPNWRRVRPNGTIDFRFTPGEQFGYSGEGYRFLQFVLEEVTGRSLNALAQERVFSPLGMNQSSYLWEGRFDGNFAVELNSGIGRFIRKTRYDANCAGSLLTHAADYGRFLLAVIDGEGLRPETLATMVKPRVAITSRSLFSPPNTDPGGYEAMGLSWASGWGRFQCPVGEALFHVGREEGCENYAVVFLDRRVGIVIQSLTSNYESFTARVLEEAIGDVYSPLDWLEYWRSPSPNAIQDRALSATILMLAIALLAFVIYRLKARRVRATKPTHKS